MDGPLAEHTLPTLAPFESRPRYNSRLRGSQGSARSARHRERRPRHPSTRLTRVPQFARLSTGGARPTGVACARSHGGSAPAGDCRANGGVAVTRTSKDEPAPVPGEPESPGGRAAERLREFEQARGLGDEETPPSDDGPRGRGSRPVDLGRTRPGRRRPRPTPKATHRPWSTMICSRLTTTGIRHRREAPTRTNATPTDRTVLRMGVRTCAHRSTSTSMTQARRRRMPREAQRMGHRGRPWSVRRTARPGNASCCSSRSAASSNPTPNRPTPSRRRSVRSTTTRCRPARISRSTTPRRSRPRNWTPNGPGARRRRRGDPWVRRSCGTGRPTDPARDLGSTSPVGSPRSRSTRRTPPTCLPAQPAAACGRAGTAAPRGFLAETPSRP